MRSTQPISRFTSYGLGSRTHRLKPPPDLTLIFQDRRARLLLAANFLFSIGSGVTMIAIPWKLVTRPGGEADFGWVTLGTTLVLLALLPFLGQWIDRTSRRTVLLSAQGAAALLLAGAAGWLFAFQPTSEPFALLVAVYFSGFLFYSLYYPALFAFNQQVFPPHLYAALTGASEVQGQTAAVVSGGLAAALVDHLDLAWILAADATLFVAAAALIARIPYTATHLAAPGAAPASRPGLLDGVRYLARHRGLGLFLLGSLLPFVGVMVGNYLWPVWVSRVLGAPASVFGLGEVTFAVGAIVAGLVIPWLVAQLGPVRTTLLTVAAYTAAGAGLVLLPTVPAFLVLMAVIGWGNAGSRVARSIVVLAVVPNALMGRVNMVFAMVDRALRAVLIAAAAAVVTERGPAPGLLAVAGLTALALGVLVASAPAVRRALGAVSAGGSP